MSWLSRAVSGVKDAVASIDPTANSSLVGHALGPNVTGVIKAGVSSAATVVTGGAALLVRPDIKDSALSGFQLGATGGTGVLNALIKPLPQPPVLTISQPAPTGTANVPDPIIALPKSQLGIFAAFAAVFILIVLAAKD